VVIAIPGEASLEHTAMPQDLLWLRATIDQAPGSACRTRALAAQGARASLDPGARGLAAFDAHLHTGLAAGRVTRLSERQAAVKAVRQPEPSFGGRPGEGDADFFRRASERLRHRNRVVTPWDLERMVLEVFPEVFKVKCIPHAGPALDERPGHAALVIIPDLRATPASNPLEPRAGEVLMGRVRDYLASGIGSAFAELHAIHPVYERLRVDVRVAFKPGYDPGYHTRLLDSQLQRFLSPWAFTLGQDILFDARVYRSEIAHFMERRDYVDYFTAFDLYHSHDGPVPGGIGEQEIGYDFLIRPDPSPVIGSDGAGGMVIGESFVVGRGVQEAAATRPNAILVSHPAHRITAIGPGEVPCSGPRSLGIGYMTVGLDFTVGPD
jgi:hypothetical protein